MKKAVRGPHPIRYRLPYTDMSADTRVTTNEDQSETDVDGRRCSLHVKKAGFERLPLFVTCKSKQVQLPGAKSNDHQVRTDTLTANILVLISEQ